MKKVALGLVILFLVLLSLFPRSIEVLNQNPVFGFDQGRDLLAVKSIVVDHKPTLIGEELGAGSAGISYVFQGPVYYYLLTIPFVLFHGNPSGFTWEMLALGLATIALGFYFGKKLWGLIGGIILAFFLACSPFLIAQSRFIWNPHAPTLFILLTFYFVYEYLQKQKKTYLFLAAFTSGFIYNFEIAIAVPLCVTLIVFSVYILRKKIKSYLLLLLGFILAFSPMILFEIRHHFLGTRALVMYLLHPHASSNFSLGQHIFDIGSTMLGSFANSFPGNGILQPMLLLCMVVLLLILALVREKDLQKKHFFYYLILLIPVNLAVFSQLRNSVYEYYLADIVLASIIVFTYLTVTFLNRKWIYIAIPISVLLFAYLVTAVSTSVKTSLYDYSDYGSTAKLKGKLDAIDYIYKDAKGKPFSLFVFTPPVYTYAYDYLVWWRATSKYHYTPTHQKKGTFYLLMEPDPQKPWTYNGWLQTVIKTGTIDYTKTLPSGFVIQKREG